LANSVNSGPTFSDNRRQIVARVHPVQIDVIGSKTAETRLAGFQNVAAREAHLVVAGFEPSECLRRQDDVFAAIAQDHMSAEGFSHDQYARLMWSNGVRSIIFTLIGCLSLAALRRRLMFTDSPRVGS
jgi:hypothetical protein